MEQSFLAAAEVRDERAITPCADGHGIWRAADLDIGLDLERLEVHHRDSARLFAGYVGRFAGIRECDAQGCDPDRDRAREDPLFQVHLDQFACAPGRDVGSVAVGTERDEIRVLSNLLDGEGLP